MLLVCLSLVSHCLQYKLLQQLRKYEELKQYIAIIRPFTKINKLSDNLWQDAFQIQQLVCINGELELGLIVHYLIFSFALLQVGYV